MLAVLTIARTSLRPAGVECKASGLPEVTPEHLEKVLPQLLLDF